MSKVIVVGAGINGVTAAIELKKRGHHAILIDPGPLPHPLAASTDISKAVRAAYGADEDYTELAERSIKLWRKWNEEFGIELYHETGVMFVRRREMKPGDFEYESFKRLQQRGHNVERMNSAQLWRRFPAWNPELFRDGVLEFEAGYAESGRAVATLIQRAGSIGVELRSSSRFAHLDERDYRIEGIILDNGERIAADRIVMAVGAWTPYLLPFTKKFFRASGQPVFHLKPPRPDLIASERFPVFGADITTTGYYGFSLKPRAGTRDVSRIFPTRSHFQGRRKSAQVFVMGLARPRRGSNCLYPRVHVLRYPRWKFLDRARSGT